MPGFSPRPIAVFVCCLFAGVQTGYAEEVATPRLKLERKFNVLGKKKRQRPAKIGVEYPVTLTPGDQYPMFIKADDVRGRNEEAMIATGAAELRKLGAQVYADKMTYRPLEDELEATGSVRLLQEGTEIDTSYLRMMLTEQTGHTERAHYRVAIDRPSRFYAPSQMMQSVVTVASSNAASLANMPMMFYVPPADGLPTTAPARRDSEASGDAERIDFLGENQFRLTSATYSSCQPSEPDWYLKAAKMSLDFDEHEGTATNAVVNFKDVPIFYMPVTAFPLGGGRRSGFLHPHMSLSSKNGFDLQVPYYWNIAPNYDATLYPRYMAKRGFQLGVDAQYLNYNYRGVARAEYLPNDEMLERSRYAYLLQHQHNLGRGFSAAINWNQVSDNTYWQDMSSRLMQTSLVQLPQQVVLNYAPLPGFSSNMQVLRYQTLFITPGITRPYFLEPQVNFLGFKADVLGADAMAIGQYTRFTRPDSGNNDRFVLYPQISMPFVSPSFQITPKVGVHMTQYGLSQQVAEQVASQNGLPLTAAQTSVTRSVPIFSLDSTVVFEREGSWGGRDYIQTLEPRLYYVNIPYRNQDNIPLFDTGLTDFNFAQIFSENRYSGYDRINDANQLTAGVTTRLLDGETGVERFKAMVGQRYYFSQQQVRIAGESVRQADLSNVVAAVTGLVAPKTYGDLAWEYSHRDRLTTRFSAGLRYQPDYGKVVSASYRNVRNSLNNEIYVDQFDIAGQWPIAPRWYAVGRYNYSIKDKQLLETIAGFEYNAGCWAVRAVAQRLQALTTAPNTTFFLQLELNDFGSIGSNPIGLLSRSIPGFGKTNELPTSSSSFLNP